MNRKIFISLIIGTIFSIVSAAAVSLFILRRHRNTLEQFIRPDNGYDTEDKSENENYMEWK